VARGTIIKYIPQAGSGTRSFFQSKLLNGNTSDANCDASHMSISLEEHDARGVTAASKVNAIYAFDWSRWTAQFKGFEADLRNGSVLGQLFLGMPECRLSMVPRGFDAHLAAKRFLHVRMAAHPSSYTNQLLDVTKLIGVRPAAAVPAPGPGFICSGMASKVITNAGFVPLISGATGAGLPNSVCRLNPVAL
jgi:hypothetical protein